MRRLSLWALASRRRRRLHLGSAESRLDHVHRLHICRREPDRRLGHGLRWDQREDAVLQGARDVRGGPRCQLHHPVSTAQGHSGDGKGRRAATGTDRALPDDSRYGLPDRLHDRPGDRRGQTGCRRLERGAHRQARCDLSAFQDRRLAAETPDRPRTHFSRAASWAGPWTRTLRRSAP